MSRDIFLNIDSIVLRGLHNVDRFAFAEALHQALTEQLAANPSLADADLARVHTSIKLPASFGAEQLSRALGKGLSDIMSSNSAATNPERIPPQGDRHGA